MIAELESYGFSGILINRSIYGDATEQLLTSIEEAGRAITLDQGGEKEWVFISLYPSDMPQLPDTSMPNR